MENYQGGGLCYLHKVSVNCEAKLRQITQTDALIIYLIQYLLYYIYQNKKYNSKYNLNIKK